MSFTPVVIGETSSLREQVEGVLDGGNHAIVAERLVELDTQARQNGWGVTFGTEIEYEFVEDPTLPPPDEEPDKEALYKEVVLEAGGSFNDRSWPKGDVREPEAFKGPIMLNEFLAGTYNSDQPDSNISEVRPSPAYAPEAIERYWNTISAIGRVAARHRLMGLILATHVSIGYLGDERGEGKPGETLQSMVEEVGGQHVAATQSNLNHLWALQLEAGVYRGMVVNEAFPSKEASTTVHERRQEFRHPLMGVVDPRVDMIASLAASVQVAARAVPQAALENLRSCRMFSTFNTYNNGAFEPQHLLGGIAVYDSPSGELAMPADLWPQAQILRLGFDGLVRQITGDPNALYIDQNGQVLREALSALRVKGYEFLVDPNSKYAAALRGIFEKTEIVTHGHTYRVLPDVTFDSPGNHVTRRKETVHAGYTNTLFGKAIESIVSAEEAIARRKTLIDNHMIEE